MMMIEDVEIVDEDMYIFWAMIYFLLIHYESADRKQRFRPMSKKRKNDLNLKKKMFVFFRTSLFPFQS